MQPKDCGSETLLTAGRHGKVIDTNLTSLTVEFTALRCEDCSCSLSIGGFGQSVDSRILRISPAQVTNQRPLVLGQSVRVSVPTGRLRLTTAVLFGLPLALGIGCAVIAASLGLSSLLQGAMALVGFVAGGGLGYCYRQTLQRQFYDRLAVTPLDC